MATGTPGSKAATVSSTGRGARTEPSPARVTARVARWSCAPGQVRHLQRNGHPVGPRCRQLGTTHGDLPRPEAHRLPCAAVDDRRRAVPETAEHGGDEDGGEGGDEPRQLAVVVRGPEPRALSPRRRGVVGAPARPWRRGYLRRRVARHLSGCPATGTGGSLSRQRFFWISAHCRSTSSRPPHMKKACSATWSYSPSAILVNASTVSVSGTVEPSMPVNCLAT